jgi:hypothetical protein
MPAAACFFPQHKTFMAGIDPAMTRKTVNDEKVAVAA